MSSGMVGCIKSLFNKKETSVILSLFTFGNTQSPSLMSREGERRRIAGGGVGFVNCDTATVIGRNSRFEGNSADNGDGAIYTRGTTLRLNNNVNFGTNFRKLSMNCHQSIKR